MLHTTPAMESIGLFTTAKHTKSYAILSDLTALIKEGKTWMDIEDSRSQSRN